MIRPSVEPGSSDHADPAVQRRRRVVLLLPIAPSRTGNGLAMRAAMLSDAFANDDLITVVLPVASSATWAQLNGRREPLPDTEPLQRTMLRLMGLAPWRSRLSRLNQLPELANRAPVLWAAPFAAGLVDVDVVVCLRSYLLPLAALFCDELQRRSSTRSRPTLVVDLDDDDASTFRQLQHADAPLFDPMLQAFSPWVAAFFAANDVEAADLTVRIGRPVAVLPNGIALPARATQRDPHGHVLMVGNFGYEPNSEGARWFLQEVVAEFGPMTRSRRICLVGTGSESLAINDVGVHVDRRGFVEDLSSVYSGAAVAVVPLLSGGGTRIKVLEAAAHHVPIVSTTIGAGGLGWRDGTELRIADTPRSFAAAIEQSLLENDLADARARSAAQRVVQHEIGAVARQFRVDVERVLVAPGNVVQ